MCLAFYRDFSCGCRNAEVDRPLGRAMLKKYGFAAELASSMRLLDPPCASPFRPVSQSASAAPAPLGTTFLLFSQNRNCIARVALLRERVPRSAFGLQRGARAQVYPQ
jgi:hypothetical protein